MKCPTCGNRIKIPGLFPGLIQVTARCRSCDTRVKVVAGLWRQKVLDWETAEERRARPQGP